MTSHLSAQDPYLRAVVKMLSERTGIEVRDNQINNLINHVNNAVKKNHCSSYEEYLNSLMRMKLNDPQFESLITDITVGESYFFRCGQQFDFLRYEFLPALIERKRISNSKIIRIWSAGCSSGQELYSIAIILKELIGDIGEWRLHLYGTDINVKALENAKKAKYTKWSFRDVADGVVRQYFKKNADRFVLNENIKAIPFFFYHNLSDENYPSFSNGLLSMDVIFCRNVFIYFNQSTVKKILTRLEKTLDYGGCLLLGLSDVMDDHIPGLEKIARLSSVYIKKSPLKQNDTFKPTKIEPSAIVETKSVEVTFHMIERLLSEERWPEVLSLIEMMQDKEKEMEKIGFYQAQAYANVGSLDMALKACEAIIKANSLNPTFHYLLGLIQQELDDLPGSEKSMRHAIFLNRDFVEAYYHLALLLLRRDKNSEALKQFNNALDKIVLVNQDNVVCLSPSVTYAALRETLSREIGILTHLK